VSEGGQRALAPCASRRTGFPAKRTAGVTFPDTLCQLRGTTAEAPGQSKKQMDDGVGGQGRETEASRRRRGGGELRSLYACVTAVFVAPSSPSRPRCPPSSTRQPTHCSIHHDGLSLLEHPSM